MIDCLECEDGSCPCGTGCPACGYTGTCSECHGTGRSVKRRRNNTRSDRIRIKE